MSINPIYTRLLGAVVVVLLTLGLPSPAFSSETPDRGALKLGNKLHCADKTYTLRESTWTWSCMRKNKTRAYSFVHPAFAFDLLTNDKCAPSRQVWFTMPGNGWAVAAKSHDAVATKQLAAEVQKETGGFTFYVCR